MKRSAKILSIVTLLIFLGLFILGQTEKVKQILHYHWGLDGVTELHQLNFSLTPEGKDVLFEGDGLKIAGTVFSSGSGKKPGIIFLHGSSVKGRKLPFCLLLCDRLAKQGFHVLSMDMRGFGESEDPALIDAVESWQSKGDISNALDFLIQNVDVDTCAVFIVGHSAGANQAIIAGIHDKRIKRIVAIGPSRRVKERALSEQADEREDFLQRFAKDRQLGQTPSWSTYRQLAENGIIDNHVCYFQTDGHKPIFLIDGSLESPADLQFLSKIYDLFIPPKKYLTIDGSNHYSNIKAVGGLVFYHKPVFDSLVKAISNWLHSEL